MVKDFSPDLTVYANKELFDAVGVTLDDTKSYSFVEMADMAKKIIKKEGDRMLTFGYAYEGAWIDRFWMVALAEKGMKLYTDAFDKIVLSGNDEAKKIAQFYFDMQKDKVTYSSINPSPNGWPGTDFTAGVLGFEQYGYWYSPMAEGDKTKGKLMLLPAPNWAGKRSDPTITATGMIMSKGTQNADAAWVVFEDYNGGPNAHTRAKSGWGVPGLKSLLSEMPQNTDFQKQCYKVLQGELALNDQSFQFNPFLGESAASNAINKYMELAVKGQIKFEEMLTSAETEINSAIKDGIGAIMG
jgi:multiple sugar transport system substrate-binding protein